IGKSNSLISEIQHQKDFDRLFDCLYHPERLIVMRAADVIEKLTLEHPDFLAKHKDKIIELCNISKYKELKWHLALIIFRLVLDKAEFDSAWETLTNWARDKMNSRIVRVNSIQSLFELVKQRVELKNDFLLTLMDLEKENIPSINARIKQLR